MDLFSPITDAWNKMLARFTDPVNQAFESFLSEMERGPIGDFLNMIGTTLQGWGSGIATFFETHWNKLGEIISGFIPEGSVDSDKLIKEVLPPVAEGEQQSVEQIADALPFNETLQTDALGFSGDYDSVIASTLTTYQKGWGRVIEYSGGAIGGLASSVTSLIGAETTTTATAQANAETIKASADTAIRALHAAVRQEYILKEVLKRSEFADGQPLESVIASNLAADRLANKFAGEITGVDINSKGEITPRPNNENTIYANLLNGNQLVAPTTITSLVGNQDLAAARQVAANELSEQEALELIQTEFDRLGEPFKDAASELELNSFLRARMQQVDGEEPVLNNSAFDLLLKSNLTALIGRLESGDSFEGQIIAVAPPSASTGTNEWAFTVQDVEGDKTTITLMLPLAQTTSAPAVSH